MSRSSSSASSGGRGRARALLLAALTLGGCAGAGTPFGPSPAATDEIAVHETVMRFIAVNYQARAREGAPQAWCLAVGRRSNQALNPSFRGADEPWNPSARLLALLGDVQPPVLPVSACGQDQGLNERVLETNEPAVLVILTQPEWESPELATVAVALRESPTTQDSAVCRLRRGVEGWEIRECV